jgi:hypothetical protein
MFFSHNFSETGCAFRREAVLKAGMFWERLFFGREGEELALRMLDAGYRILILPLCGRFASCLASKADCKVLSADNDFHNALRIYSSATLCGCWFGCCPKRLLLN